MSRFTICVGFPLRVLQQISLEWWKERFQSSAVLITQPFSHCHPLLSKSAEKKISQKPAEESSNVPNWIYWVLTCAYTVPHFACGTVVLDWVTRGSPSHTKEQRCTPASWEALATSLGHQSPQLTPQAPRLFWGSFNIWAGGPSSHSGRLFLKGLGLMMECRGRAFWDCTRLIMGYLMQED